MIQDQNNSQRTSSLLILANHENDFLQVQNLLCNYFPSAKKGHIHLDTKYYLADVQIIRQEWPQQAQVASAGPIINQQQPTNTNPDDKQDLLLMLVNQKQSFLSQTYDYVINKYNPENFILIVNTKDTLMPWIDEEKISNEVNNFIEIIKENLELLNQNPPQRTKKGLLTDSYEDGNIFNLLELIQTTPWSNITRKTFEKNQKPKAESQGEKVVNKQQPQNGDQMLIKREQQKPEALEQGQQMTDQQLQSEMNAFESMMSEMQNLRAASSTPQAISNNDRKRKAQDLMKKLVGGWM